MTENPRTESARDHDDSAMIDEAVADSEAGAVAGSSGGRLQTDIGAKDDLKQAVDSPDDSTRPEKADDMANDQSYGSDRR